MPRATLSIVAVVLLLVLTGQAAAYVPADLDRGFGQLGVAASPAGDRQVPSRHNLVSLDNWLVALFDEGRTIECGYDTRVERVRLGDGVSGGSGGLILSLPCPTAIPKVVAAGRDELGRLYIASGGGPSLHITRLAASGLIDLTFGVYGTKLVATPRPVLPELLRVGSNESLTIAGVASPRPGAGATETALMRIGPDGALDPSFGDGGVVFFDAGLGESTPEPSGLAIDTHGEIFLSGPVVKATAGHQWTPAGVRAFLPDGRPDRRFGKAGVVKLGGYSAPAMVFSKQRVLVAVNRDGAPSKVVSLTEAGNPDRLFGRHGVATLPARQSFHIAELAIDGNDRLSLAGTQQSHIVVDRLEQLGRQDRTFAGGGVFKLDSVMKTPFGAPTVEGLSLSSGNGGGGVAITASIGHRDVRFRLLGQTSHERCGPRRATIVGSSRGERIVGTPHPDTIAALGGADTIVGGRGNDVICGGSGRDTIEPGPGRDTVFP